MQNRSEDVMRKLLGFIAVGAFALLGQIGPAPAKGCVKGAVVGGVAGHYAGHHGLLGAAAGCLIGRHEANKRARQQGHEQPAYDAR
jgi:hypothetical protein